MIYSFPQKALALVSARHVTRLEKTSSSNNALQVFWGNDKSFFGAYFMTFFSCKVCEVVVNSRSCK